MTVGLLVLGESLFSENDLSLILFVSNDFISIFDIKIEKMKIEKIKKLNSQIHN